MYNMFNRGLFIVELQKYHMQLDNHCLKGNLSGLHVLLTQIVCGLFFVAKQKGSY